MERIPILRMGDLLLVTIQVDMHDRLAMTLQDDLTQRIVNDSAKGVLIDISALDLVDSFIGRMMSNTAAMARVLDATTVVVRYTACGGFEARRWRSSHLNHREPPRFCRAERVGVPLST